MIKTKETAIKHLEDGEKYKSFSHKDFNLFRNDEEVVLVAIKRNYGNYDHQTINTLELAKKAAVINPDIYLIARTKNPEFLKDDEFYKLCAKNERFMYFQDEAKSNKEIAKIHISGKGSIAYFDDSIKNDKQFQLLAVEKSHNEIQYLNKEARNDKDIVLKAMESASKCSHPEFQINWVLGQSSKEIQELCKGKDPLKTLQATILHEQLQKEIKPKGLDFAKSLSAECKQAAMEQSKPKARMKI